MATNKQQAQMGNQLNTFSASENDSNFLFNANATLSHRKSWENL